MSAVVSNESAVLPFNFVKHSVLKESESCETANEKVELCTVSVKAC